MFFPPLDDPLPFPADAPSAYSRYSQALQLVMMDFQFIEESLRMCLVRTYALVSMRTRGELSFKPPFASLQNDPLGRLISKFEQFFDAPALIRDLKKIQPFRNQCAHRGMLHTLEEQKDVDFLAKETRAIDINRQITRRCLNQILKEAARLDSVLSQTR